MSRPSVRTLLFLAGATVTALAASPALALDPGKSLADCTLAVWRVRDGLPGGWVRALAQTDDGYLWIGTYGGLARYDGDKMTVLASQAGMRRLSDVASIHPGKSGTLWVMPSFGLPACVRGTETINCIADSPALAENARIETALFDGPEDIWIATRKELVHDVGGKAQVVIRHDQSPWHRIETLVRDHRGRLWLGTDVGLFVQTGGTFVRAPNTAGITTPIFAFTLDRAGVLWAGGDAGLVRIADDGDRVTTFDARAGLPAARVDALLEDRDGNLWIGTRAGLVRLHDGAFKVFGTADGLPDAEISVLFEDREGGLWVGMRAGGLAQFTDRTIDTRQGPPFLRGEQIETVAQDEAGALWLGWRNGLVRWQAGVARTWGIPDGLDSAHVLTVMPDGPGVLWVGTVHGLQRMHDGKIDQTLFADGPAVALALDRAGGLWVGSAGRVGHIDPHGRLSWLADKNSPLEQVRAIERDDQGTVWVSGIGGIARLVDGQLVRVRVVDGQPLPSPRAVHRDRNGTLWFGTSGGLLRRRNGQFHLYGAAQGLLAEQIHQVMTDDYGYLWLGTSRGVFRVSERELDEVATGTRRQTSPVWFDTSDERRDLAVTNVRQPGSWRAQDGRLWFASDHGLITLDPRRPHVNPLPPNVIIEEADADGRKLRHGDLPHVAQPDELHTLPPGPGNLDFTFTAITLIEPRKARMRYRLEGFEADWVDAQGRRTAHYTNIAPGRYRFRVQGANADGIWNETGDTVELRLRPHFYRTPWFYALAAALLASLGYLIYRGRLGRLRREYLAAFAERGRVARELHDTLLQSLSAVGMHLRAVRRRLEGTASPSARELEGIENMVSLSLEETRRFVWNLREQPIGSGDLGLALQRLAPRLTEGHEVQCHVTVEGEVVALPNAAQGELFRIAQEAITNALKHAKAERIDVRLCYEGNTVRLAVSDDGRGFDPEKVEGPEAGHFGLLGMRERAGRLGTLTIDSLPETGTMVTVTVDLKRQEFNHG